MAEKKSQRLQRIVNIQRQKEKMAEIELADVVNAQRYNQDSMESVLDALGTFDPIHMVCSGHYSKRLSNLDIKKRQLQLHREMQEKNMMKERVKADRLEERVDAFKMNEAREAEDEGLQDLIDTISGGKKSSLW